MTDIISVVRTIAAGMIGIAIVAVVLSAVVGFAFGLGASDVVYEPAPGTYKTVSGSDSVPDSFQVTPSTGNSIGLYGDGYVEPPRNVSGNGSWAFATTAEPMWDTDGATVTLYGERDGALLILNEAGDWTARYDVGNETAFVSAPASGARQTIGVSWDASASELRLYVDGTLEDSATPTATIVPRETAYTWDGTIDETRAWDVALNKSQHAAYAADPVQPVRSSNATLRLMYNEDRVRTAYYAPGDAEIVGDVTLESGVQPPTMVRGSDYEVRTDPLKVRATDGGYFAGAPVMFVSAAGPFIDVLHRLVSIGTSAFGLLVIGLLVLAANAVFSDFSSM